MIVVDVEDYCQQCMDFNPDVTKPEKLYGGDGEIVLGNTVIQCKYRKRCAGLWRFLENRYKSEVSG